MVRRMLILGFAIALWSCHKNDSTKNTSAKRLTSVSLYVVNGDTHDRQTDSILYDNNNRMIECRRMFFDTIMNSAGSITYVASGHTSFVFSYSGSNKLPSSYLTTYSYSSNIQHHLLTYDNDNQIMKDSSVQQSPAVVLSNIYFSYAPNTIVAKTTNPSGFSGFRVDSFLLQNANVTTRYYKFTPQSGSNSVDQVTYSTIPNPLYNFKGIGILLYEIGGNYFDYVSQNLFSNISNSSNLGNTSIIWSTDADGNAISGSGLTNGSVALRITFNYN